MEEKSQRPTYEEMDRCLGMMFWEVRKSHLEKFRYISKTPSAKRDKGQDIVKSSGMVDVY